MTDRVLDMAFEALRGEGPGVASLPATPEAGPVVAAVWQRGNFGAVLTVRRWKNGTLVYDAVPCYRDDDWRASAHGGADLPAESYRSLEPEPTTVLAWLGETGTTFEIDSDEEWCTIPFTMLIGYAADEVSQVRVSTPAETYDQPVYHPPGLVIVGVSDNQPVDITPLDHQGEPITQPS